MNVSLGADLGATMPEELIIQGGLALNADIAELGNASSVRFTPRVL